MAWRDLHVLLDDAAEQDARAARDSENLAMLVDRSDYWLGSEYTNWITDPDDPSVKAERERRKAARITPPPRPLLLPIACRAPEVSAQLLERHRADVDRYSAPARPEKLTIADYNRMRGITGGL